MTASLEELLLRDRILDTERIEIALEDARRTHKSLAETVIDLGFVEERRFAEWVAGVSGARLLDPLPEDVPAKLERRLPPATARLRMAVPVGEEPWGLLVAMLNPLDETTLQVLKSTSGSEILPVTGIRGALERLVNRVYPEQLDGDATVMPNLRFTFNPELSLEEPVAQPAPAPVFAEPPSFAEPHAFAQTQSPDELPAPAGEDEPFDFSTRTLLSSRSDLVDLNPEQPPVPPSAHGGKFGTLMAQPLPDFSAAETPAGAQAPEALARIEQRLDAISGAIERLQRRLDALDMTLMKFMNR